jgi:hypothetical protein
MVVKRAVLVISLLLFALSSFPATERFLDFELASQAFASTDEPELFHNSHDLSGLLSRLVRVKLSIKSLISFNMATYQTPLAAWLNEAVFSPFHKYSVFQRTNVLRL